MTIEEFETLQPGTKLLVGYEFLDGADDEIEQFLGEVITFKYFKNKRWVYFEEGGDNPFRYNEIVGIYNMKCIDDEAVPYQSGDISLIFGEVC